jgi:hypothetical protein
MDISKVIATSNANINTDSDHKIIVTKVAPTLECIPVNTDHELLNMYM